MLFGCLPNTSQAVEIEYSSNTQCAMDRICVIDDILVLIQFPVHTAVERVWQHSPVAAALRMGTLSFETD